MGPCKSNVWKKCDEGREATAMSARTDSDGSVVHIVLELLQETLLAHALVLMLRIIVPC